MHVYKYIYIYICRYTCRYSYTHIVFMCTYTYMCVYVYIYEYVYHAKEMTLYACSLQHTATNCNTLQPTATQGHDVVCHPSTQSPAAFLCLTQVTYKFVTVNKPTQIGAVCFGTYWSRFSGFPTS